MTAFVTAIVAAVLVPAVVMPVIASLPGEEHRPYPADGLGPGPS